LQFGAVWSDPTVGDEIEQGLRDIQVSAWSHISVQSSDDLHREHIDCRVRYRSLASVWEMA
jgi:hypothetical protein